MMAILFRAPHSSVVKCRYDDLSAIECAKRANVHETAMRRKDPVINFDLNDERAQHSQSLSRLDASDYFYCSLQRELDAAHYSDACNGEASWA